MHIAIIGTRGIPNNYGGFEQFAEYLAFGLVNKGHQVTVYNPHNHPYQAKSLNGVEIIHCYDPEFKLGTVGQFIYDFLCIKDTRKRKFDVILQLGYTSSSIWGWMLPSHSIAVTNMDGLEWKRTKFSNKVKKFLLYAEKLGVKYSDYLVADSIGIQEYLAKKYKKPSTYIPYGSHLVHQVNLEHLSSFNIEIYGYSMLIARLEPENSIEIILDGVVLSGRIEPFLVIGKHTSAYGEYLKGKYADHAHIQFVGGIYEMDILNAIRNYSNLYFHGHTVGGTNPSLLEAMASNCLICAKDNLFNKYILGDDGIYFNSAEDVALALNSVDRTNPKSQLSIQNNRNKIEKLYSWDTIIEQYLDLFKKLYGEKN